MMEKSVWRTSGHGSSPSWEMRARRESSEFSSLRTGGKLRVISYHFTELVIGITEMEMLVIISIF